MKQPRQRSVATPEWLCAIRDPFGHAPVAIPDELAEPSVKAMSRATVEFSTIDVSGATTSHGCLLGILPMLPISTTATTNGNAVIQALGWNSVTGTFGTNASATYTQSTPVLFNWPNVAAIVPSIASYTSSGTPLTNPDYHHRCTAMEVRLTSTVPEIQRGGMVTGFLFDLDDTSGMGSAIPDGRINAFNLGFGQTTANFLVDAAASYVTETNMRNRARRFATERTSDGTHVFRWLPLHTPKYIPTLRAGTTTFNSLSDYGPLVFIMIQNDYTTAASTTGNTWQLDIVAHWEITGVSPYSSAIPLTPSPYDPSALAIVVNAVQSMSANGVMNGVGKVFMSDGEQSPIDGSAAWETIRRYGGNAASFVQGAYNTPAGRNLIGQAARAAARFAISRQQMSSANRQYALNY